MSWLVPLAGSLVLIAEGIALVTLYVAVQPASGSVLNAAVGSVALASMIGMLVYSLARRIAALRNVMRLSSWLALHIFLGLQGVLLAYVHCLPLLWRHGWPILVNPGMLNLYAVTIVFLSGLFGRYLYAQVPKTLGGQHMALREVDEELAAKGGLPDEVRKLWADAPAARSIVGVVLAGFARRRALYRLSRMKLEPAVRQLAARRLILEHQKASIVAAQRVFRYWILLHRPIALAMYLLSFVHVAISLLFATGWGWI